MRGKKAKMLRMIAGYSVTKHRPKLPTGGWQTVAVAMDRGVPQTKPVGGTCVLPKSHPRHKYQFVKRRYGKVPLAHSLKRSRHTRKYVENIAAAIDSGALGHV